MSLCSVSVAEVQHSCVQSPVTGGEFGRGKRGGGVSTLLVGVLDDRHPVDRDGPK